MRLTLWSNCTVANMRRDALPPYDLVEDAAPITSGLIDCHTFLIDDGDFSHRVELGLGGTFLRRHCGPWSRCSHGAGCPGVKRRADKNASPVRLPLPLAMNANPCLQTMYEDKRR